MLAESLVMGIDAHVVTMDATPHSIRSNNGAIYQHISITAMVQSPVSRRWG